MRKQLIEFVDMGSKASRVFLAFALLILIGLVNHLTGSRLGISIFYLIPILLAAHRSGTGVGLLFSLASAGAWLLSDLHVGIPYPEPLIHYWNAVVRFGFFGIVILLHEAWEKERVNARKDVLTSLANRQAFLEILAQETARARRYHRPLTLCFLDCDDFKAVNDTQGHGAGDQLLTLIARALKDQLRSGDVAARFGGDEFLLLLPEMDQEEAIAALPRLHQAVTRAVRTSGFSVTLSMGGATYPESIDQMISQVDRLMYSAKQAGKDRVVHEVITLRPESR